MRDHRPPPTERRALLALLARPPQEAAPALLGQLLVRRQGQRLLRARIVETEAYLAEGDPAAHVFRGRTPRNAPLFGKPGTLYVYLVYGVHHCLNLACAPAGVAGCVLVRAAEPLPDSALAARALSGPGRLCRALGLDARLSGRHLFEPGAPLTLRAGLPPGRCAVSTRVGLRRAAELPLRFYDPDSAAVSRRGPCSG